MEPATIANFVEQRHQWKDLLQDGEAWERLQSCGREVSVLLQPADILDKIRKQFKSLRGYKDFVLS